MKRLRIGIMALLLCVFLAGCGEAPLEETVPETQMPATEQPVEMPESTELAVEIQPTETEAVPVLPEPADDAFVRVKEYIPDIVVELKYATEDNFTGQVIYDFQDAFYFRTFLFLRFTALLLQRCFRPCFPWRCAGI